MDGARDLARLADSSYEQFFLVAPDKLSLLINAAGIRPEDQVVEVGAGAGTVARMVPQSAGLTLVELDERLIPILRAAVPRARIIQGDALAVLRKIPCDVLLSNLPNAVTESLLGALPELPFRTAVIAVGATSDLGRLSPKFMAEEIATIQGDDFQPPQATQSRLIKVTRAPASPRHR